MDLIIAARDCASSLAPALAAIPVRSVRSVVVVDNGSTDSTATVARDAGCVVLREPRIGTGAACLRAIAHLETLPRPPDAVVFMAADGSDDPRDIPALLAPIESDNAELVIGVRQGKRARSVQSRVLIGMIGAIYRHRFDDLGPYRAIRFPALVALALSDPSAAFHIEMQVKAIKLGLHIAEVPVRTRLPPGHKRPNPSARATGKAFFHILRHSTSR